METNYYQYSARQCAQVSQEKLIDDIDTDVCIIGAGLSGINTALELGEQGVRSVILEASDIGWGASGRNGGQAIRGIGHDIRPLTDIINKNEMNILQSMPLGILSERVKKYGIDCDFRHGYCTTAFDDSRLGWLKAEMVHQEASGNGGDFELLEGSDLDKVVLTNRYKGGLLDKKSAHLNPLKLLIGEARAAIDKGASIFVRSKVISVEKNRDHVKVITDHGSVNAKYVVYCCNAYLNDLSKSLHSTYVTTTALNMVTEPLSDELFNLIIPNEYAICDNRPLIDYYRRLPGNRLMFGGGTRYWEYIPSNVPEYLSNNMIYLFPQLKGAKIDFSWHGKMAVGANLFPQIGMLDGRVLYCQAYAGFGLAPSHLMARLISEKILGNKSYFDKLSRVSHINLPFSSELGRYYTIVGKWHQQLKYFFKVH